MKATLMKISWRRNGHTSILHLLRVDCCKSLAAGMMMLAFNNPAYAFDLGELTSGMGYVDARDLALGSGARVLEFTSKSFITEHEDPDFGTVRREFRFCRDRLNYFSSQATPLKRVVFEGLVARIERLGSPSDITVSQQGALSIRWDMDNDRNHRVITHYDPLDANRLKFTLEAQDPSLCQDREEK